jgi:hypothetical protein
LIRVGTLRDSLTLVTLSPSGETSDFGDPLYDEDESTIAAAVTPLEATEEEINRETRINRYYAMVRPEVEISGIDHVLWEGRRFEILGEPQIFSQRGREHHKRIELREVEG